MTNKNYLHQISIGIPVWGVEKYIQRCLESVLNQDFDDMEVLVIDDCGLDNSIDITERIKQNHPKGYKIRIIHQPYNQGCWAARNRIIDEANGKYIFFLDSDDYLEDGAISLLYDNAERNNVEATYGSIDVIEEGITSNHINNIDGIRLPSITIKGKDKLAMFANDNIHKNKLHNFVWNILLRADFIKKHNLKFRQAKFMDDILFVADMQPLIESFSFLSSVTYHYVIRANSLSNFQSRSFIGKEEINQHICNQRYLIQQSTTLIEKPYYETRVTKTMLGMFYTLIGFIKNSNKIKDPISAELLSQSIRHPLRLFDIMRFHKYKKINLLFWIIGILPSFLSAQLLIFIAQKKNLL